MIIETMSFLMKSSGMEFKISVGNILIITFFLILIYFFFKWLINKKLELKDITISVGGVDCQYSIVKSYSNLEIANKIYTELVTRKAALPIDEENDIIYEVHNSFYILFQTTREEVKQIKGQLLKKSPEESRKLIQLVMDILNKGIRPHLTQYQGRFKRWYELELKKDGNKHLSPQQIQQKFPQYNELIQSLKQVNILLQEYSKILHNFIYINN